MSKDILNGLSFGTTVPLPLQYQNGGTGLSHIGTANQVLAVNPTGTGYTFINSGGAGAVDSVSATGPLQSSGGIDPVISIPLTTGSGETVVLNNNPEILNSIVLKDPSETYFLTVASDASLKRGLIQTDEGMDGINITSEGYGGSGNKRIRLLADTVTISNSASFAETPNKFSVKLPAKFIDGDFSGDLTSGSFTTFDIASQNIVATGNAVVGGTLTVAGETTLTGNTAISGALEVGGLVNLLGAEFTATASTSIDLSVAAGNLALNLGTGLMSLTTGAGALTITTGAGLLTQAVGTGGYLCTVAAGAGWTTNILQGDVELKTTIGNAKLTSGSGNTQLFSNTGAINMLAGSGGVNIGGSRAGGTVGAFYVETAAGTFGTSDANISFVTKANGFTGPGNITLDTSAAFTGDIFVKSKNRLAISTFASAGSIVLDTSAITASYNWSYPATSGTAGQVLTSGGSGVLSWTTLPPFFSLVTSVTATAPLASSGGSAPVISIGSSTGTGSVVLATNPTITGATSSFTSGSLNVTNTNVNPLVSQTLLAPNITTGNGILYAQGQQATVGNSLTLAYNWIGAANSSNFLSLNHYGSSAAQLSMTLGGITTLRGSTIFMNGQAIFNNGPQITGSGGGTLNTNVPSSFTSYNWNFPATPGTAGQFLTSQGGGSNDMTWTSVGGGAVTSVTASSPLSSTGGTSPVISISSSTGSGAVVLTISPTIQGPTISGNVSYPGTSSGTITSIVPATFTSYNWNYPSSAGTIGQVLTSQAGSAPMTWTSPITTVTATSPLSSSGGTTPVISISSSTGTGAVVLANNPTINFATVTGSSSSFTGGVMSIVNNDVNPLISLTVNAPNLTLGNYIGYTLGQATSTGNSALIRYFYNGVNNAASNFDMGLFNVGTFLNATNGGLTTLAGSTSITLNAPFTVVHIILKLRIGIW